MREECCSSRNPSQGRHGQRHGTGTRRLIFNSRALRPGPETDRRVSGPIESGVAGINTGSVPSEMARLGGRGSGFARAGSRYGIDESLQIGYLSPGGTRHGELSPSAPAGTGRDPVELRQEKIPARNPQRPVKLCDNTPHRIPGGPKGPRSGTSTLTRRERGTREQ